MYCLHCGICCKTMSPLSAPFRCPDLIEAEGFFFCRCYDRRPEICRKFDFEDTRFCYYGLNHLRLSDPEDFEMLQARLDRWERFISAYKQRLINPNP